VVGPLNLDDSDRHRQLESSRPGAAGIEQEHAAGDLFVRLVTVAEDDHIDLFVAQLRPENVRQKNPPSADGHPNDVETVGTVVVAWDERDRRDGPQRLDDVRAADVARVQNRVDAFERFERLGPDQPVRVGDDADARRAGAGPLAMCRTLLATARPTLSWPRSSFDNDP
jgi:hypothetical protein